MTTKNQDEDGGRPTLGSGAGRSHILLPTLLTSLALGVRLIGLGSQSLWFDETVSVFVARQSWREGMAFLAADGVHPPLSYVLQKAALVLGDTEFAFRLPAAVLGALAVFLLYRWTSAWIHPRAGAMAALLLALSPLHIWYSREARMYSLLVVLMLAGIWTYARLLREPHPPGADFSFLLLHSLAYLTHYFGAMLALIELAHLILNLRRHAGVLRRWILLQAGAAVPLGIWVTWVAQRNGGFFGIGWIPAPTWRDPLLTFLNFGVGYSPPLGLLHVTLAIVVCGLALRGLVSPRLDASQRSLLGLWAFLPLSLGLAFSIARPLYVDRFFLGSLPALLALAALAWSELHRNLRAVAAVTLVGGAVWGLLRLDFSPEIQKEQWREAGAALSAATAQEVVIPRFLQIVVPLAYSYEGDAPVRALEVNRQVASLEELSRGAGGVWLVFWNASADAHSVAGNGKWDPEAETDPEVADWLRGEGPPLLEERNFVGVTVLHFGAPEPP